MTTDDSNTKTLRATRPGTDQVIWEGPVASAEVINARLAEAREALPHWRSRTAENRISIAKRFAECAFEREAELTASISQETGKPVWEARAEARLVPAKVKLAIDAFEQRSVGETIELPQGNGQVAYRPAGVMAVLGPFNFPAHLPNGHLVPALIAGNTAVFKPSERTPGTGALLCELWHEAGLPDGVLHCVQGERETGAALVAGDIDAVLFTGSEAGGRAIHRALAGRPEVMLALEMGGNNPLVIDETADLEAAAYTAVVSAFASAGQRCTCARRMILTRDVDNERLLDRIVVLAQNLRVGLPEETPDPFMGPLISTEAATQVLDAQTALIARGAEPLLKAKRLTANPALLSPSILQIDRLESPDDEEVFGPLLQVKRVDDFEQAIHEANRTRYGLSASLLSSQRARFDRFRRTIRAGVINWNQPTVGASGRLPFGGLGASGNHRPSGFFAADYCSDAIAILETPGLVVPENPLPGINL